MSIWRQTNSRIDLIKDSKGDGLSVADSDDDNEDEDNNENENDDFDRESNSEFEEYSDSDEDDYDEESEDDDDDIPSDQEFGESARRAKPASEISNERKSGDGAETPGGDANGSAAGGEAKWPAPNLGPEIHGPTDPGFDCEAAGEKLLINETIHAPLGVVANLLFGDNVKWITKFITDTEKNFDLKNFGAFDSGLAAGSKRVYEYIKPLNGPVGPKQTKCMCTDTIEHWDLDGHITVITKTSTPDVPSGGAFTTKTRYTLYWADGNATRLMLSYLIDWTGKSWFKGPIEKGTHDGQMVMANHLIKDIETSIKRGGAVSKAKVNKGKKGKAPGKKKKTTSLKSGKARSEASEAAPKGWLTQIVDLLQINPIPMVSVPLWGVLLIVLFLYLLFSRLFGGPGADHYTNSDMFHLGRDKFSRDKLELLRLQEEYNVWHWLDDRSNGIGIGFSEISAAGKRDAMARSQLHAPSFDKAKYYEQDLREAIKLTELRVRELKRVLNM